MPKAGLEPRRRLRRERPGVGDVAQEDLRAPVGGGPMAGEDLDRRRRRHRDEHAEEPEEAAADDDRQQHPNRVEVDAPAEDAGGEEGPLD